VIVILAIDLFGIVPHLRGEGLLIGVVAGLVAAFGAILHGNLKNSHYFHADKKDDSTHITLHLAEEVSFLNKASIRKKLDEIPENSLINIDATDTEYIDFDVLELIKEFRDIKAPLKNINCTLTGFKDVYEINSKHSGSGH
jgi:carbonic anhydrase